MVRKTRRTAGARWRLLAHEPDGPSHNITHDPTWTGTGETEPDTEWSKTHVLPGVEFDELVVGSWLHIEQLGVGQWWMSIGGVVIIVNANRDGKPTRVAVHKPGDYDNPIPGVTYGGAVSQIEPKGST